MVGGMKEDGHYDDAYEMPVAPRRREITLNEVKYYYPHTDKSLDLEPFVRQLCEIVNLLVPVTTTDERDIKTHILQKMYMENQRSTEQSRQGNPERMGR